MFEPTDFTDEGLRKWGAEQLLYASTISANDDRYAFASVLSECAYELEAILFNPNPQLMHKQAAILAEIRANNASPVPDELGQAYRESHPEVMALVKKMLALRNHAEHIPKELMVAAPTLTKRMIFAFDKGDQMKPLLQWLWFALAVVMCINFAFWWRYVPTPISTESGSTMQVWDRWQNRACIVGIGTGQRIACSMAELQQAAKSIP